ncbi:MAG: NAD-dependent epimerase/dehydratase family protein, partial [Acidobacteria bacterium]|nr:NAD-dependent epimerase/dehydratase family protein [Acidobacteriota bacterium]
MGGRVLITGAAGFLGSHVAAELHRKGHEIVGLDDLSHGNLGNLAPVLDAPRFQFIQGDVCDPEAVGAASIGAEAILHFALYKLPRYGGRLRTLETNVEGTRQVLEAARRHGCRVVYASTDDVYGKNQELPFGEESALVLGDTAA